MIDDDYHYDIGECIVIDGSWIEKIRLRQWYTNWNVIVN